MAATGTRERASAAVWRWRPDDGVTADGAARRRGLVRAAIGLVVALLLAFWKPVLAAVAGVLALLLLAAALLSPAGLLPRIDLGIAAFARGVARAVTWLVLVPVHVLVFLPLGLLLRASRRLRIEPSLDEAATTYWRPADGSGGGPRSHERQF